MYGAPYFGWNLNGSDPSHHGCAYEQAGCDRVYARVCVEGICESPAGLWCVYELEHAGARDCLVYNAKQYG